MLTYKSGDERPYWEATVTIGGVADDLSTGYTFEVNIATAPTATPTVTKTTGITGSTGGVVTVAWAAGELGIAAGTYVIQLTATRTSDSKDWTVEDIIRIDPRLT